MDYKGKKVRLVKLTDDRYNGKHPNGIYKGQEKVGYAQHELTVGIRFYIASGYRWFLTSRVTEIVDERTFKTDNSTYSIEIIN